MKIILEKAFFKTPCLLCSLSPLAKQEHDLRLFKSQKTPDCWRYRFISKKSNEYFSKQDTDTLATQQHFKPFSTA